MVIFVSYGLAGCQTARPPVAEQGGIGLLGHAGAHITSGQPNNVPVDLAGPGRGRPVGFAEYAGVRQAGVVPAAAVTPGENGKGYVLNFVDVELQEFVRIAFDEIFKDNVLIDPALKGKITVRTTDPLGRDDALTLTSEALKTVGARLARTNSIWKVTAAANPQAGVADGTIRIIPLKFLDGTEARQALQQFAAGAGAELAVAGRGRYLIVNGRPDSIDELQQVLATLDVNELQDRNFALIPIRDANAASVSNDLVKMFGPDLRSHIQIFPIERMNAVMLISSSQDLLTRARGWVRNLDQAGEERRTYVYPVRNRRAAEIATVLDGMLKGRDREREQGQEIAPGLTPDKTEITSSIPGSIPGADFSARETKTTVEVKSADADVQVRADIATNTLVIMARAEEYRLIESAIRNLDVLPTQVLIEATIAEVTLNDTLRHGVRYFFKDKPHAIGLTPSEIGSVDPVFPGFNYTFKVGNSQLVLSALESVTDVEVVSSPALTVLDNQTATLKVGDQVPIATRSSRSVTDPEAPIVNDIELKDTGVILAVTPRVSSSGLVMLDIKQEASDVVPTTTSSIDSPTIRQREITSTVAVQSGAEIVLGGIITRKDKRGKQGVPFFKDIPLIGEAFTSDKFVERGRTELLIIIRPVVMRSNADVRAVTDEIKARLQGLGSY